MAESRTGTHARPRNREGVVDERSHTAGSSRYARLAERLLHTLCTDAGNLSPAVSSGQSQESAERFRQLDVTLASFNSFDEARVGSVGAALRHYSTWKPVVGADGQGTEAEVAAALCKAQLSEQEHLIAGLLRPAHLLDVIRHFTLFMAADGQVVKSVCRYQQHRAVNRAILRTGKTRRQDGEHDRRGGIVWHTHGSGKSLTMVFLMRKLRTDALLRRW